MKNWLHDVVKHTKPFNLEKKKIVVKKSKKEKKKEEVSEDWSFGKIHVQPNEDRTKVYVSCEGYAVVISGETDKCLFEGSAGWGLKTRNLERYLTTDALGVDPVITCEYKLSRENHLYPSHFLFQSLSGQISARHANMCPEVANDIPRPERKLIEPFLSLELSPNVLDRFSSLTKLKDWESGDYLVDMYIDKGRFLVVSGDHSTLENTSVVLQQDIDLEDTQKWSYNLDLINKALSVSGDKTLHFFNEGALEIYCESYYSQWRYFFPAQGK